MRISVMQPYIFPYVGYFHLIEATDVFVFYDDVHYIKGGWINRNRILNAGEPLLFTVPVEKPSPNRLILETHPKIDAMWRKSFAHRLRQCYHKAPYLEPVFDIVVDVFKEDYSSIADMAIASIRSVYSYLGCPFDYVKSSEFSPETKGMERADRLIAICRKLGAIHYINSPGGRALYSTEYFETNGITLSFMKSLHVEYQQMSHPFVPSLSVIDLMMFNSPEKMADMFSAYHLS